MRLFIGTFLGNGAQVFYRHLVEGLVREHGRVLRAVPAGSLHLTHAFGAAVPDERLPDVRAAAADVAGRFAPIAIALDAPRALFAGWQPRLICADVTTGAPALASLVAGLAGALASRCGNVAWRPSTSPHVTLARFRRGARHADADDIMRSVLAAGDLARADLVERLQVVASELTASGSVYRVLHDAPMVES